MKSNVIALMLVLILSTSSLPPCYAQGITTDTVVHRDLRIDLGGGLMTDAQLTFPTVGKGPFPGILLIHGSGYTDMNEYLPPTVTGSDKPVMVFLQIAEYLSERGFAVLRYNKRGVGLNGTILNQTVVYNMTFQDLVQDAEKAVSVLKQQPEVNADVITLIGHSEGTMIAPRIAIEDPTITKIVLMGAVAQNLREILYFQLVDRIIAYSEDTIDTNHDGLLSVEELVATFKIRNVINSPLPPQSLIQNTTGRYDWLPTLIGLDANLDNLLSIQGEIKPLLQQQFILVTASDPKSPYYSKWLQSDFALKDTNLALIGNVTSSILILQGEADTQTPIGQALLLEQRLTELNHPDHSLISYPDLGHTFYPTDGWIQPLGSIQENVLADLGTWLKDPARTIRYNAAKIQADEQRIANLESQNAALNLTLSSRTKELEKANAQIIDLTNALNATNVNINDLQAQTKDQQSKLVALQNTVAQAESKNTALQSTLNATTSMAYIALGMAILAVAMAVIMSWRRRSA